MSNIIDYECIIHCTIDMIHYIIRMININFLSDEHKKKPHKKLVKLYENLEYFNPFVPQ